MSSSTVLLVLCAVQCVSVLAGLCVGRWSRAVVPRKAGASADTVNPAALTISTLTRVENQWFRDVTVPLDGYHFYKCRFERCTLITGRGDSQLTLCFFADGTALAPSTFLKSRQA